MVEPQRKNDQSNHQPVNGYIYIFIEQNIIQQCKKNKAWTLIYATTTGESLKAYAT